MSLLQNEIRNPHSIGILRINALKHPDLTKIGHNIYDLLNVPPRSRQEWKKRLINVEIKPDHTYSPMEVGAVLSVSYDTATRIMSRMKRVTNFAKPRAKKRLLRIKGSDLRAYIQDKLEN